MRIAEPLTLPCGHVVKNRIAKAAMSEGLATLEGAPTDDLVRLYRRFAEGGAGMVITGNVVVDARYLERPGNVIVEDDTHLEALRRMAAAANEHGALSVVQVNHPGRQTNRFVHGHPVAPSEGAAVKVLQSFAPPRALTGPEVLDVIARFVRTALVLERAGFGGVQIHAAHGYLLSQFLSPLTNRRTDEWGGSLAGRAKVLLEIVRQVRARVAKDFVVGVKVNSADFQRGGFDDGEAMELMQMLSREGVDFVEISGGNYESPALLFGGDDGASERTVAREAYFLEFAERARKITDVPLMVTGGFRTLDGMNAAVEGGAAALVGLARPLALDPALPARLLRGECTRIDVPRPFSGKKPWHSLAESAFYGAQLARLGAGQSPDLHASYILSMVVQVVGDVIRALARRAYGIGRDLPEHRRLVEGAT